MDDLQKRLREGIRQKLSKALERGRNASTSGVVGKANKNSPQVRTELMEGLVKPVGRDIYKGAQAGSRLLLGNLLRPQQSIRERNMSTLRDMKDVGVGVASVAGLAKLPASLAMAGIGTAFSTGTRYLQKQPITSDTLRQDAISSLRRSIPIGGVLSGTQPLMRAGMVKLAPRLTVPFSEQATRSVLNVGEGLIIDQATGLPTTPTSVAIDAIAGVGSKSARAANMGDVAQANAKGFTKGQNIDPRDVDLFDQAVEIMRNKKKFTPAQVADAKRMLVLTAERYFTKEQLKKFGEGVDTNAIIRNFQKLAKNAGTADSGVRLGIVDKTKTIGQLQQAKQIPELTQYEKAINSGNYTLAEQISKKFPNDARFGIHKMLQGQKGGVSSQLLSDVAFGTGGLAAGIEVDDQGNISYDKAKGLTGAAAGVTLSRMAGKKLSQPDTIQIAANKTITPELRDAAEFATAFRTFASYRKFLAKSKTMSRVDEAIKQAGFDSPQDFWRASIEHKNALKSPAMGLSTKSVGVKPRGFEESVKGSKIATKQVKQALGSTYDVATNKQAIEDAAFALKTQGWDASKKQALEGDYTPQNNALGQLLAERAIKENRIDDAIEIVQELSKKGTSAGQYVQAFSMWSKLTPQGMLKYAQNQIDTANQQMGFATKLARDTFGAKAPKLTPEDGKIITDLMKKAQKAGSEEEKALYARQALEYIGKKLPWGVNEVIDEFRYNNMLSGPLTHLRNLYSNVLQAALVRPATLLAEGKPLQAAQYEAKVLKTIPEAFGAAMSAFKQGKKLERLDDVLGAGASAYKPKRLGKLYNIPSSALEASDTFFTTLIKNGELARGATEAEANKAAQYWVFRQALKPEQQGALLNGIDNITGAIFQLRKVGLGWTIPFLQTPMNIAKQSVEFSPVGVLTTIGAKNKREQLAKAGLGSIAMMAGTSLAMEGRTTWDAPTDPKEKELFYASGKKPYSVLIKDKWVPLQYFGPFAWAMGLPAAAKYYEEDSRTALSDDDVDKLVKTMSSGLKFWSQQTFVQGLGQFVKLAEGDYDYNTPRIISNFATQLNPMASLQRYVAQIIDPVYRKPKGNTFGEKLKQNLQAGIPFQTQNLEAYTNPLGEESKRNITAFTMPWGLGIPDRRFDEALENRTNKLQDNAVKNKIKRDIEAGVSDGTPKSTEFDNIYTYFDPETGQETNYDMSFLAKEPTTAVAKARYEDKKFETAIKVFRDENLGDEARTELLNKIGINADDLAYYDIATSENVIKAIHVKDTVSSITDRGELLQTLVDMRRPVNNKFILADGVIDELVESEIISKDEGAALKKLDYTLDGKLKVKMTGRGKSSKLKNVKFVPLDIPTGPSLSLSTMDGLKMPQGGMSVDKIRVQNISPVQIGQPKFQVKFNL